MENLLKELNSMTPEKNSYDELYGLAVEICKLRSELENKKGHLITINPKPDTNLREFVNKVKNSMAKKWIKKSCWCFEWRKNEDGLHCHGIIEHGQKRPSEIIREFKNTFKNMIGTEKHINIKKINNKAEYLRCIGYLKGMKRGTEKNNHDEDLKNRKKYNLENIYNYVV